MHHIPLHFNNHWELTGKLFFLYGNVQCPLSGVPLVIQRKEKEFNTEREKGYVERKHVRICWYIVICALLCSKIPDLNSLEKFKDNSVDKRKANYWPLQGWFEHHLHQNSNEALVSGWTGFVHHCFFLLPSMLRWFVSSGFGHSG